MAGIPSLVAAVQIRQVGTPCAGEGGRDIKRKQRWRRWEPERRRALDGGEGGGGGGIGGRATSSWATEEAGAGGWRRPGQQWRRMEVEARWCGIEWIRLRLGIS